MRRGPEELLQAQTNVNQVACPKSVDIIKTVRPGGVKGSVIGDPIRQALKGPLKANKALEGPQLLPIGAFVLVGFCLLSTPCANNSTACRGSPARPFLEGIGQFDNVKEIY